MGYREESNSYGLLHIGSSQWVTTAAKAKAIGILASQNEAPNTPSEAQLT